MSSLLTYALTAFGVLLAVTSLVSARSRLILFYILMFMTMGGLQIELPLLGSGMRSALALLLLAVSWRTVATTIAWLRTTRILTPMIALAAYLLVSNLVISTNPSLKTSFENAGNFIFFLICVAFLMSGTDRQVKWLLIVTALGLLSNILAYTPRWIPFMSDTTVFGPVPHYQEPASSGLIILPILLMFLHSEPKIRGRVISLAGIVFVTVATFITGARTPSAAYIVVLALYRRKIWWALSLLALGALVFTMLPENEQTDRMVDRIQQLSVAARTGTLHENPDAGMRLENVRIALTGFMEKPVFGWGIGSWHSYRQESTGRLGYILSAHSGWALLLFETGVVGAILYLLFLIRCLKGLKLSFTGDLAGDVGYIAFLGVTALMLVSLGGDTLLKRGIFTYFSFGAYARCAAIRKMTWERAGS